jgi:hypothetical protein
MTLYHNHLYFFFILMLRASRRNNKKQFYRLWFDVLGLESMNVRFYGHNANHYTNKLQLNIWVSLMTVDVHLVKCGHQHYLVNMQLVSTMIPL